MKNKQPVRISESGDGVKTTKQMILELPLEIHAWVREIADATSVAQPKVVLMVLQQASVTAAKHYIDQLNQIKAETRAKELEAQLKALKDEYEAVKLMLN